MLKKSLSTLLFLLPLFSYIGICGHSTADADEAVETVPYELQTPRIRQLMIEESRNSRRRSLVPLPMKSANNGPFGSYHYSPDAGLKDVFVNYQTNCAFQNLLNEWQDKSCKAPEGKEYEEMGCRVSFGNISHRDIVRGPVRGWPHVSHTHGYCFDIRPMRRGGFEDAPLTYGSGAYDATKTAEFLRLAQQYGADPILFNDPNVRSRRSSPNYVPRVAWSEGHDNHMHICIRPENIPADRRACPSRDEALR